MNHAWMLMLGALALAAGAQDALKAAGLTDVATLDPTIRVDLKYSTEDNFLKADVYGDLATCYLQPAAAEKLKKAQTLLHERHAGHNLLVFDCARPRSIQRRMWDLVKDTAQRPYVANPATGSIHNYGAAVDLSIANDQGVELDMGTPFDFFGELAEPRLEERFLKSGALKPAQVENRKLLRDVMTQAGFQVLSNEWWHFDAHPKKDVRARYVIIE